ncbi:782_t:CDS:1 [Dentiscutata heterogama]|uniref:782_t:CDS:1 n=1 Tax=Dentiscutata heterogama TaxID=1316150 RepID=A0ACA9LCC8_9GLOM|nr:782_t:CDS:1 [Dentiscutata heterogama]
MNQKTQSSNLISMTSKTIATTPTLVNDCLYLIFKLLITNKDLYSCALVSKSWAAIAIPILWEAPFRNDYGFIPSPDVINVYMAFLPHNGHGSKLSPHRIPFDYPSYLKELPFDRFCNFVGKRIWFHSTIIKLLKMFTSHGAILRKFEICSTLANQEILNQDWIVLPSNPEFSSLFGNNLTYFTCGFQWTSKKVELFNALALNCHNIKNLKVKVFREDEGIALANLICAQKQLNKFSLLNSNNFASIVVQALICHTRSLGSLSFKHMNNGHAFRNAAPFTEYTLCQLNKKAVDVIVQCANVTKLKFIDCEGLNSSQYYPIGFAFSNLTSLTYTFGACKDYDYTTPIKLLSDLIRTSCNTLEMIVFFWSTAEILDISQLIQAIICTIRLKVLRIPLYKLEELSLIYQFCDKLENLNINLFKTINPNNALRIFANKQHNNLNTIYIWLYYLKHDVEIDEAQLDWIFAYIFFKNKQIKKFTLDEVYIGKISDDKKISLQKKYPKLKLFGFNDERKRT